MGLGIGRLVELGLQKLIILKLVCWKLDYVVSGGISIRFLEKMDCEGDKRAFKFEGDRFVGAVRLGNAQNSLCRLAARSLPSGALATVRLRCVVA